MNGKVITLSLSQTHSFSKPNQGSIKLLAGLGVEGDTHLGEKLTDGKVSVNGQIRVELPLDPHESLKPV